MKEGWVYILSNRYRGTLYIGVTANLPARIVQHRERKGAEFPARHGLTRLVWCEHHDSIEDAIRREKAMKKWLRAWKIRQIEEMNPEWEDLFERMNW